MKQLTIKDAAIEEKDAIIVFMNDDLGDRDKQLSKRGIVSTKRCVSDTITKMSKSNT